MSTITEHLDAAAYHLEQARLLAGQRRGDMIQGDPAFELWAQIGGATATVERIARDARKGERDERTT